MSLPSLQSYVAAFRAILPEAPAGHRLMLSAHLSAPNREITAKQLAAVANYNNYSAANLQYGKLARKVCEHLHYAPAIGNSGEPTYTYILARSRKTGGEDLIWTMHEGVVAALREIEAIPSTEFTGQLLPVFPDEVPEGAYLEGSVIQRLVNARERDREARDACIEYWGTSCSVCEVDGLEAYGVDARRFIHVHHLRPLSSLSAPEMTDPIKDLRPVCPSCHAVLHFENPPISIDSLRSRIRMLRRARDEG